MAEEKTCDYCGGVYTPNSSKQRYGSRLCASSAHMERESGDSGHLRRTYIQNCAFQCRCGYRNDSALDFRAHLRSCQGIVYYHGRPRRLNRDEEVRSFKLGFPQRLMRLIARGAKPVEPDDDLPPRGLRVADTPRIDKKGRKWWRVL